jgi:Tfp pilus assembly protein PilF
MPVSQQRPRRPAPVAELAQKSWTERLREARQPIALSVLLIAATLLVYAQTWWFGYALIDDPIEVSGNPRVQAGLSWSNVVWCFSSFFDGNWIPLTWLSLMLDTTLFGFRAGGYHFTNVIIHAADAVLLFAFLARATGKQLRSACVAALFALHPLHVESVAWITERKDVLSGLFGLLSLLAYARYATNGRGLSYAVSIVCFVASLLSKQTLVTLPFLLLLLDFWPLGRFNASSDAPSQGRQRVVLKLLLEKVPFLAVSLAFSVIAVFAQKSGHSIKGFDALPLAVRCENAIVVYADYLAKTFFPRDLVVYYPHPGAPFAWTVILGSAAVLAAISAAAIAGLRRFPFLFVGWAWYLGTLVPMIGIVQVGGQQMADRYTYFPIIGLFVALVWLICELVPVGALHSRLLPSSALAVLAVLGALTFVQVGYWRDDVALFEHALASGPDNSFSRNKLGCALVQRGKLPEAVEQFDRAIRLNPRAIDPHYNLGLVAQGEGRLDAAAGFYRDVLALTEEHADAHNNLGAILLDRGQYAEAKKHFLRAAAIAPTRVEPQINLGAVALQSGDYAEAIAVSQRALALDSRQLAARYTIVQALLAQHRFDEAIGQLRAILAIAPNDQKARSELARLLAKRSGP